MSESKSKICVITITGDLHLPYVTRHLKSEYIVLDAYKILEGCELSFRHQRGRTTVIYGGKPVTGIESVWYRKPQIPQLKDLEYLNVPESHRDYSFTCIRNHIYDLYASFQDAFWLSDFYTILKAGSKPRQLQLAADAGFKVPETLSTSSKAAAAKFLNKPRDVIVKTTANLLPVVDGRAQWFFASRIPAGKPTDLKGLHLAPAIFQQAVNAALDIRVTVVDNQVFAAAVRDDGYEDHPRVRDWRFRHEEQGARFEPHDLPKKLQQACIEVTHALGLRYGAIDLILDEKGQYWFLEINPNGQWAFIEEEAGLPIGKAIAELLDAAGKPRGKR